MEDGVQETAKHTERGAEDTNGALVGRVLGIAAKDVKRIWSGGIKGDDCVAEDVGESWIVSSGASIRSVMARPSVPVDV